MQELYHTVLDLLVYATIASFCAWYYYFYRAKPLLGGFWGACAVAGVGAVVAVLFANVSNWFQTLVIWLMIPKINGELYFRINIIAAFLGALLFLHILKRIHSK